MSTNVSFASGYGQKISRVGVEIRNLTGYNTFTKSTALTSEGSQKQTFIPFGLSMVQEPAASFAPRSDCLEMHDPSNHTPTKKKRKYIIDDNSRSTDLLKSLKLRRVDWRYVENTGVYFDVLHADKTECVHFRWAVEKGFLDKTTHEWNEERGGLEGYLEERNQRMLQRCKSHLTADVMF
jgi:hypothetical protein